MRLPGLAAYRRWRRRRICMAAHERMQELVDGELPEGRQRRVLEEHVERCAPCGTDAGELQALKEAIRRVGSEPDPAVKARLVAFLDEVRGGSAPREGD
ncbi:MAG TPA: zf-HC2 domain-containing protein [Acidimicrobiia bacterium]|nr:zf-HC2 domain-containing protein [Acidimicrobiia bacterium]